MPNADTRSSYMMLAKKSQGSSYLGVCYGKMRHANATAEQTSRLGQGLDSCGLGRGQPILDRRACRATHLGVGERAGDLRGLERLARRLAAALGGRSLALPASGPGNVRPDSTSPA